METKKFKVRAVCQCDKNETFEFVAFEYPYDSYGHPWWAISGQEQFLINLLAHGLANGKATFKLERIP